MERINAVNTSYTGTSSAVKILDEDPKRAYIALYSVSGDAQVVFGGNDFATNAVTIPEGLMWEPRVAMTSELWFKGSGSVLTIIG